MRQLEYRQPVVRALATPPALSTCAAVACAAYPGMYLTAPAPYTWHYSVGAVVGRPTTLQGGKGLRGGWLGA